LKKCAAVATQIHPAGLAELKTGDLLGAIYIVSFSISRHRRACLERAIEIYEAKGNVAAARMAAVTAV